MSKQINDLFPPVEIPALNLELFIYPQSIGVDGLLETSWGVYGRILATGQMQGKAIDAMFSTPELAHIVATALAADLLATAQTALALSE